jgi:hypothetical protein
MQSAANQKGVYNSESKRPSQWKSLAYGGSTSLSPQVPWYLPKDEAIDLAVLPFGVSDKVDAIHILLSQFLTSDTIDKQGVVPGTRF